jgi:hypothetical protein
MKELKGLLSEAEPGLSVDVSAPERVCLFLLSVEDDDED